MMPLLSLLLIIINALLPVLSDLKIDYSSRKLTSDRPISLASQLPSAEVASYVILSGSNHYILAFKNDDKPYPIASLTKLMTVLVANDLINDWNSEYQLKPEDRKEGGRMRLFNGDRVRVKDLFYSALVGSDNVAAIALVRATGLSEEEFVDLMNARSKSLGLTTALFVEPTGLDPANLASASDVAKLLKAVYQVERLRQILLTPLYEFRTKNGKKVIVESTNKLLLQNQNNWREIAGKTGSLDEAGYCFVALFKDQFNHQFIVVILGAKSDQARFIEAEKLADWTMKNILF